MRLLSRALFTLALLGGLAFGSYSFGKYVLSAHLFGPKGASLKKNLEVTTALPPTSPKTVVLPTSPPLSSAKSAARVDVEVLPANSEDGTQNSADLPPLTALESDRPAPTRRETPTPQPTIRPTIAPDIPDSNTDNSLSAPSEDRPRRRTRRRRSTTSDETTPRRRRTRRSTTSTREAATRQDIAATGNATGNDTPRPTRRRERVRDTTPSAPARRFETSPIPQPEGNSGGDSPVPIPE